MAEWDNRGGDAPLPRHLVVWTVAGIALVGLAVIASLRCQPVRGAPIAYESRVLPPEPAPRLVAAPAPDENYYPCSDCHADEPTDPTVRKLEFEHDDWELAHGDLWCLHCHEADNRDLLHLADGSPIAFGESWRLCVQCHGEKLADWRAGVHGKRSGHWWGDKEYEPCVTCHAPHRPRFEPLAPRPPPVRPEAIVWHPASDATEEEER